MASTTSFHSLIKAIKARDARVYVHGLIELNDPTFREGEGALYNTTAGDAGTPTMRVVISDVEDKEKLHPHGTVVNVTGYLAFNKANRKVAVYTTTDRVGQASSQDPSPNTNLMLGKLFVSFTGVITRRMSSTNNDAKKPGVARWDVDVPRARKPFKVCLFLVGPQNITTGVVHSFAVGTSAHFTALYARLDVDPKKKKTVPLFHVQSIDPSPAQLEDDGSPSPSSSPTGKIATSAKETAVKPEKMKKRKQSDGASGHREAAKKARFEEKGRGSIPDPVSADELAAQALAKTAKDGTVDVTVEWSSAEGSVEGEDESEAEEKAPKKKGKERAEKSKRVEATTAIA